MSETKPDPAPWWGEFQLAVGSRGRWHVGPLDVHVERRRERFDLAWSQSGDRRSEALSVECPAVDCPAAERPAAECPADEASDVQETDAEVAYQRRSVLLGAAAQDRDGLSITPLPADRPVVTRPSDGCVVLPGRTVTLYVSTPLWLRLETAAGEIVFEAPTVRLSDTWFGPSTRVGELCYAIRTRAFPDLEELPVLAFRAITRLRIENTSHGELELARLSLPAPNLSIWHDAHRPESGLWTSHVVLRRSSDGETAEVDVVRGAPPELSRPERVAWPRQRESRNVLVRAMGAILG